MTFTQKTGDMLQYLDEARKKYGPVVDETLAKVESWGTDTFKEVQQEGESILRELADMVKNTPEDPSSTGTCRKVSYASESFSCDK